MDIKDISAQAERYKTEMMKLYGKRQCCDNAEESVTEEQTDSDVTETETEEQSPRPNDEEIFGVDEEADDDTAYFPYAEDENNDTADDSTEYNNKYPDPDLSELETDSGTLGEPSTPPEYVSEAALGSGTGYILVNVRAGDQSMPIEGATVMVTAIVEGNRLVLAEGLTNSSGTTEKFSVPAPDANYSKSPDSETRPYSLYDVSVSAAGFFNARSVDVPVFSGITSVQNFSMIPVPLMMNSSDETVTYFNQEPYFGDTPEK